MCDKKKNSLCEYIFSLQNGPDVSAWVSITLHNAVKTRRDVLPPLVTVERPKNSAVPCRWLAAVQKLATIAGVHFVQPCSLRSVSVHSKTRHTHGSSPSSLFSGMQSCAASAMPARMRAVSGETRAPFSAIVFTASPRASARNWLPMSVLVRKGHLQPLGPEGEISSKKLVGRELLREPLLTRLHLHGYDNTLRNERAFEGQRTLPCQVCVVPLHLTAEHRLVEDVQVVEEAWWQCDLT